MLHILAIYPLVFEAPFSVLKSHPSFKSNTRAD